MNQKKCHQCKKIKAVSEYYMHSLAPDGFRYSCKKCWGDQDKKWKESKRKNWLKYRREWAKNQRHKSIKARIDHVMSSAIRRAIKSEKAGKAWKKLTGYGTHVLMEHLEKLFTPEMNWNNYASYWEIDHIKPLSKFTPIDIMKCWELSNLQPLEVNKNRIKGNQYNEKD